VIPLSPLDVPARCFTVHFAFMYARDQNAAMLQHALAVGHCGYCPLRHRHAL
jgi:hypothetical protein